MTNSNWEYTQSFIQIEPEGYKNNTFIFCVISPPPKKKYLKPPSGFEHGTPEMGIQCLNHNTCW